MTTSELLNTVVAEMATKKGYAYTTGYLQSMLMELSYGLRSKALQDTFREDLQVMLRKLEKESV
jgi:hypothetical protein